MSVNLGYDWEENETPSQARLSAKSVFSGSGADIAALPSNSLVPLVRALTTESGYTQDELYFRSADGLTLKNIRRKHTHFSDIDTDGGDLVHIYAANAKNIIYRDVSEATRLFNYPGSTGSLVDEIASSTKYIKMQTGTAANSWSQTVDSVGKKLSLTSGIWWFAKIQISHSVDILWRVGPGMELVSAASDIVKKFGLEGCAADGVYVQIVTCDGITRTKTPTTLNMAQGQARGFSLVYTPASSVVYTDSTNQIVSAGSNVPSSGVVNPDAMNRFGILTTNTTQKQLYLWNAMLIGRHADPDWVSS